MKIIVQRVKEASVTVEGREISSIGAGLLLLVGVGREDTHEAAASLAGKISRLRIFEDTQGKMNLDLKETGGQALSVPQFTLFGNTRKGNRPGFDDAAEPETAKALWMIFNGSLRKEGLTVKEGAFGSHMHVRSVNDGPVTFILESKGGTT